MRSATRVTVSAFGVLVGLAGIEHGIGETLQGGVEPDGMMILSWPESELFRILAGEPAMTILPNLLVTGILAIFVSLIFLVWATMFVRREHGGLVLILLSVVMLLVGGGFGPPILGILLGLAATRIDAPRRAHLSAGSRRSLARLWPWSLVAGLIAWLLVFPGSVLLDYFAGMNNPDFTVSALILAAFGLLSLAIVTAFAHDGRREPGLHRTPSMSGNQTADRERGSR